MLIFKSRFYIDYSKASALDGDILPNFFVFESNYEFGLKSPLLKERSKVLSYFILFTLL